MNVMNILAVRMVVYGITWIIGLLPASFAGGVAFNPDTMILTLDLQGLITATITALALNFGVLKRWGITAK